MKHWWSRASAFLAFLFELERFADGELHFAESANWASTSRLDALDLMFVTRTAPADWTAVVLLVVDGNATVNDAARVAQVDATVDFVAARILLNGRLIAEIFRTVALVAVLAWIHPLTFAVCFALEHAC